MAKGKNIAKCTAAKVQNAQALVKAVPEQFLSVQRRLGNGYFTLRTAKGKDVRGTPRGLFTSGTMRIAVGQIVIVEKGDQTVGVEIIGVVGDPRESREPRAYVRAGRFPAEVLAMAASAGAVDGGGVASELDDLFEAPAQEAAEMPEVRGGIKAQRAAAATDAAIASRVAALMAGGGGESVSAARSLMAEGIEVEEVAVDLEDL